MNVTNRVRLVHADTSGASKLRGIKMNEYTTERCIPSRLASPRLPLCKLVSPRQQSESWRELESVSAPLPCRSCVLLTQLCVCVCVCVCVCMCVCVCFFQRFHSLYTLLVIKLRLSFSIFLSLQSRSIRTNSLFFTLY